MGLRYENNRNKGVNKMNKQDLLNEIDKFYDREYIYKFEPGVMEDLEVEVEVYELIAMLLWRLCEDKIRVHYDLKSDELFKKDDNFKLESLDSELNFLEYLVENNYSKKAGIFFFLGIVNQIKEKKETAKRFYQKAIDKMIKFDRISEKYKSKLNYLTKSKI